MISRWKALSVMALALTLTAGGTVAQQARESNRSEDKNRRREKIKKLGERIMQKLTDEVNLTEDEQKQMQTILQSFRQDIANWLKENGPAMKALHKEAAKAAKDKDKEALKKIAAKRDELTADREKAVKNRDEQIVKLLGEQRGAKAIGVLQKMRPGNRRRQGRGEIMEKARKALGDTLSEEQKKIINDTRDAVDKAKTRKEKVEAAKAGFKKLRESLTDEQKAEVAKLRKAGRGRRGEPFGRIEKALGDSLTAEQKKIISDARSAAEKAENPREKAKIYREAAGELRKSLTDEQKKTLGKAVRKGIHARKGRQGGRDGAGPRTGRGERNGRGDSQ